MCAKTLVVRLSMFSMQTITLNLFYVVLNQHPCGVLL